MHVKACSLNRQVTKALACLEKLDCSDSDNEFRAQLEEIEGYVYLCSNDTRQGKLFYRNYRGYG